MKSRQTFSQRRTWSPREVLLFYMQRMPFSQMWHYQKLLCLWKQFMFITVHCLGGLQDVSIPEELVNLNTTWFKVSESAYRQPFCNTDRFSRVASWQQWRLGPCLKTTTTGSEHRRVQRVAYPRRCLVSLYTWFKWTRNSAVVCGMLQCSVSHSG